MTHMQTRNGFRPLISTDRRLDRRHALAFWALVVAAGLLWPTIFSAARVDAQTVTPTAGGTYIVQPGDSWTSLSRKTGIS
ncbi:MAG: hypothetical protein ACK47M_01635, partial [Caldilinea sp.]